MTGERHTVEIVDVFPDAVKVRAETIRPGDCLFSAMGDRLPVASVRMFKDGRRMSTTRDDGVVDRWDRADTVTIARAPRLTGTFRAHLGDQTFTDPTLFEAAATTWRKAQPKHTFGRPMTGTPNGVLARQTRQPWSTPRPKPFAPSSWDIGAEIVTPCGRAQVWDLAPRGGVWLVLDDGSFLWADPRHGDLRTAADGFGVPGTATAA